MKFTSESVTIGHPDKVCDFISDSILDAYLKKDKNAKVACEVAVKNNFVYVFGEITSVVNLDIEKIVRSKIVSIGYDNEALGFNGKTCEIKININKQSPDIALGVDLKGAGDQGMMFGYATSETDSFMPLAAKYANDLAKELEVLRKTKLFKLRPDGKTQVTIDYEKNTVDTIVISTQHDADYKLGDLKKDLKNELIEKVIPKNKLKNTKILINPTGRFVIGGPVADAGLTGRKIIVDTYGGYAHHGGGAFSGKDYTKVDRSAAYYARYVAKNLVAAGISKVLEIQVSYAIGVREAISINVNTFQSSNFSDEEVLSIINKVFDFSVENIIEQLDLKNVTYSAYSAYGHFGTKAPWENLDKVKTIKELMN